MILKHARTLLLAPFVFCLPGLHAQEINFRDVLNLAIANSPSIKAKEREFDASNNALKGAQWGRYPALSLSLSSNPTGVGGNLAPGTSSPSSSLRLDQPLYAWGAIDARIRTADLQRTVAKLSIQSEVNSVSDRIIASFGQVITAQEKIIIQQEAINRLVEFEGMIGRRLATQLSSKNDASLVNSRLQQARSELVQSRSLEVRSRAQLEEITGQSVKQKLIRSSASVGFENLDALQMASVDSSSEFASARLGRDLAENQIKQRSADLFPKLSGRVERVNSPSAGLVYTQAYVVFEASLGNGLSQLEGVNESSSRLLAAEQQIEVTRRTLFQQSASTWADYVAYRDQAAILKDITQENEEIVASFVRQYLAGKKSWLEVLNAERELVQSRLQMADLNSSLMSATYRLQRLSGQLNISKETTLNE